MTRLTHLTPPRRIRDLKTMRPLYEVSLSSSDELDTEFTFTAEANAEIGLSDKTTEFRRIPPLGAETETTRGETFVDVVARREISRLYSTLSEMQGLLKQSIQLAALEQLDREVLQKQEHAYRNVLSSLESHLGRFVAVSYDGNIIADDDSESTLLNQLREASIPPDSYFIYEVGSKIFGPRY